MINKYQVVITDNKDYIIEFKDFTVKQLQELESYITFWLTKLNSHGVNVKITRWNKFGERV